MSGRRLLIDFSAGFNQGAGIGRYSRSLLGAALPLLAERFDIRLWYASDAGATAQFENEARNAIPDQLRTKVKRSRWSRKRVDQLARLPVDLPTALIAGSAELAYSPDFTLPGAFGGPGMITVHDVAFEMIPTAYPAGLLRYLRTVVPKNIRRATVVGVVSRTTRIDVVERYNIDPARVVVVPNAADERFFDAVPLDARRRGELGLPDEYLLAVGTIEPRKNYLTLLRAQEKAFASSGRPLVLVGRPGWHNQVEIRLIGELANQGKVVPLINAADADLPGLYAGATAFAYVPLYEGFGLPVLEAMAAGTAIITSDIPSVREVASGFATTVPPLDVDQLAEVLAAAVVAPDSARAVARQAARQYSWQSSGTILTATLSDLAARA
jgi:glycosyltransferase involved in cell wall biosynthesis